MGGGGMDAHSVFESVFGGGGGMFSDMFGFGGGGGRRQRSGDDIEFTLHIPLKHFYCGAVKKLRVRKKAICSSCEGTGSKSGRPPVTCTACRGRGFGTAYRQIGPGMVQQMQVACDECSGEGEVMDKADRCSACKGKKVKD